MADIDDLRTLVREVLAELLDEDAPASEPEQPEPVVVDAGICTRCKQRPVRKVGAYLCASCKAEVKGHESTGYVASRIRASKTERPAKQAASRAFAERVVAAISGVPTPKRAGAHVVVTTPEVMRAVNTVAKPLVGESARRDFDAKAHTVTLTFDSAARAKAFASAAGDAATS